MILETKMKDIVLFFCLFLFLVSFLRESNAVSQVKNNGVYIVYMGAAYSSNDGTKNHQAELMNSLIRRNKDAVVQSYNNGFSGFAARLSEAEAKSIAQRPGVISVFPDPILQLHTTRSWDFLQYQTEVVITSGGSDNSSTKGADTIIGILDTGIWPEAESFNDNDMSEVPSRWKGTCMESHDSSSFKCNKKLVGARFYGDDDEDGIKPSGSARDQNGHGTHVASTAAGSPISGASYYGLGSGIAKGGSPGSRIVMYRVCTDGGCHESSIMKAFDDAIADRVDVLSLSLGSLSGLQAEFSSDPIAIGAFHAVEKGILVACSAGNQGPRAEIVFNVVPWILTVAATIIDRDFETHIVLGGNKVMIKGGGISFGNLTSSPVYPLITGDLAKSADSDVSRYCLPDSVGIFAITHSCSGVATRACGLVSLEPTKIAEILKDRPPWFRDCRNVKVITMFSAGSGGTVELLLIPSGYLIRPYDGEGSIIHIVDHLNLEAWSAPEILRSLYESSKDVDGTLVWSIGTANKFVSGQFLNSSYPLLKPENVHENDFDFGIFLDALQSRVAEKRNFFSKLSHCFWWGLRNLSSLGQDLKTSNFLGEILFTIFNCIVDLILLSLLIGNMQEYLQSITVRVEGMRLRRRDAEQWMSHRMLPDNLRERIRRYEQHKWQQTRGVDEDYLISNLPRDLRRDVKRHLCWSLLKRVPMFAKMDEPLLDALCDRLKPALSTENSFIIREGNPVNEMFFLMRAQFRRLHSKQLRHTFRSYSQHWRTWAACFVQAAWRRHCRNKLEKSLREEEEMLEVIRLEGH